MTRVQYIPQWLRKRLERPAPQENRPADEKDPKVMATVAEPEPPTIPEDDDSRYAGYRALWRL